MARAPTATDTRATESAGVESDDSAMPPRQKIPLLTVAALLAVVVLAACRKEVPPPPGPEEVPKPKADASTYALPSTYVRLGR